jgi:hypothetical protein
MNVILIARAALNPAPRASRDAIRDLPAYQCKNVEAAPMAAARSCASFTSRTHLARSEQASLRAPLQIKDDAPLPMYLVAGDFSRFRDLDTRLRTASHAAEN